MDDDEPHFAQLLAGKAYSGVRCARVLEQRAQGSVQVVLKIGFLKEGSPISRKRIIESLAGISRDEQHLQIGTTLRQLSRELDAAHSARHRDVADQRVERRL